MSNQKSWYPSDRQIGDAIRAAFDQHDEEGKEAYEPDFRNMAKNPTSGRRIGVGRLIAIWSNDVGQLIAASKARGDHVTDQDMKEYAYIVIANSMRLKPFTPFSSRHGR